MHHRLFSHGHIVIACRHRRPAGRTSSCRLIRVLVLRRVSFFRSIFRLAPAPSPQSQETVNVVILPDPEVASTGRTRILHLLDVVAGRADDGDRSVGDGEVLVLLQRVGQS